MIAPLIALGIFIAALIVANVVVTIKNNNKHGLN